MQIDMGDTILGPTITLAVENVSVGIASASLKPTSGVAVGRYLEIAVIKVLGPLYMESGGGDATSLSFPMEAANDVIVVKGYNNIEKLRFIRNTNNTSIKIIPGYI